MTGDEVAGLSLTDVAGKIAAGELSSVETTEAALARIDRYGERLHVVAGIDPEAALADAAAADKEQASGNLRGPLHGVPLAHKDMYYRAGRISACGSTIRKDFVPEVTSTALMRLDAAGALDVARLNMVEFAYGPTGHNEVVGTPRNPWNPDHITGGSSSGPGAAVASRMVYAALGSDTGGSIRIPSYCCGLVGMKATYGRVSRYGAMPLSFSLDHVGPLTRTVADCAIVTQTIAGPDPMDPTTSNRPVGDYMAGLEAGVKGLRIAVPTNYFYDIVDDALRPHLEASVEVFRELGAEIVPVEVPSIDLANRMINIVLGVEAAAYHAEWLGERAQDYGEQTRNRLLPGLYFPATRYIEALNLRRHVLAEFSAAVFGVADMLHAPNVPVPVPPIDEGDIGAKPGFLDYLRTFTHCTRPINFLGLPSLAVPCGFTEGGLPCGFQLVGRPFDEATLFRAGRAFERETGCTDRAPELEGA